MYKKKIFDISGRSFFFTPAKIGVGSPRTSDHRILANTSISGAKLMYWLISYWLVTEARVQQKKYKILKKKKGG